MLAELMRLRWSIAVGGTHGKTTTTSLIAAVLEAAQLDPTVINGGIINAYGTNTRLGAGDWMVVEADESDGSFLRLPAMIAVVTNMDPEHLDHWGTAEAMIARLRAVRRRTFRSTASRCCASTIRRVQQMIPRLSDRRIVTYGFSPQADVRAERVVADRMGATFEVVVDRPRCATHARRLGRSACRCSASHNVQNALAADRDRHRDGDRRRDAAQRARRRSAASSAASPRPARPAASRVIDDYGHHPVEIAAVLKAARQAGARDVVAVVQPHRYTRPAIAVRGVLHLHERCRHGDRGRRLCGRRGSRSPA